MSETKSMEPRKSEVTYQTGEPTRSRKVFLPRTDIIDTGNEILVIVDVPGVDENGVDLTLEKNLLTISATPPVENVEKFSLSYVEYEVGDFER